LYFFASKPMKLSKLIIFLIFFLQLFLLRGKVYSQATENNVGDEFYLENLFKELHSAKSDTALLRIYTEIYHNHYNLDTIIKYADSASKVSLRLSDGVSYAEAIMFIGAVYNQNGENQKAASYFCVALDFWIDSENLTKQAVCYNCLAVIDENLNHYESALTNYSLALDLFLQTGDTLRSARIYRGMSNTYSGFNLLSSADEYLNKALEIDLHYSDMTSVAFDYVYLGNIWLAKFFNTKDSNNLNKVKEYYKKGLSAAEKSNFLDALIESSLSLQKTYLIIAELSSKDDFLVAIDSSRIYKELAQNCIEKMSNRTREFLYCINDCREKILLQELEDAKKIIDSLSNVFLSDLNKFETIYYEDFGPVLSLFYKKTEDYKSLYLFSEKYKYFRNLRYSLDFAVKGEKKYNATFFGDKLRRIEQESADKNALFHKNSDSWRVNLIFLITFLTLLIFIVIVLRDNAKDGEKTFKTLKQQKNDILEFNKQLSNIRDTALSQNMEIRHQSQKINEQNIEISNTNRAITHSIEYARQIQLASMPLKRTLKLLFNDLFLIYKPLDIVSGDFYWCGETSEFKIIGVFDCTGHGISGGLLSMLGISILNDTLSEISSGNIAAEILNNLRKKIISFTTKEVDDGIDGAVVAVSKQTNTLCICGAMRPVWIERDGEIIEIMPERMSVSRGKYQNKPFVGQEFKYQKNDIVYLFTDGMTDVFGYSPDTTSKKQLLKFSQKRLKTLLSQVYQLSLGKQKEVITYALEDWQSGLKHDSLIDDQLMIGFKL